MNFPHLPTVILIVLLSTFIHAKEDLVAVKGVKFAYSTDKWIVAEIKIDALKNPKGEKARNEDYLDNVKVILTLAYEPKSKNLPDNHFDFYRSEVEIITIKTAAPKNIYFALPGSISERDKLSKDPYAWMVEIEVDGQKVEPQKDHLSKKLQKNATSFIAKANAGVSETEDLLVPSYLAPNFVTAKLKNQPDFKRKDAD